MALKQGKSYSPVNDIVTDVLDSDFDVSSASEYTDMFSEELEMIDNEFDPLVDSVYCIG